MGYVLLGALGFPLCFAYDLFAMRGKKYGVVFFSLGGLLIGLSTLVLAVPNLPAAFASRPVPSAVFSCCALACLGLLIHALFFALPAKDAYASERRPETVSTGVYALCRHPGFWFFALLYLFLALLSRRPSMTAAAVVFTTLEGVYVYLQDKFILPRTHMGYNAYQKQVPFLIPRFESK